MKKIDRRELEDKQEIDGRQTDDTRGESSEVRYAQGFGPQFQNTC